MPPRMIHSPHMNNFNELPVKPELLQAISELGYETPTPIQAQTLPILLEGDTDFLGLAATGTGKTAAFSIPMLERLDRKTKGVQALILCPTRELAIQVAGQIDLLGKYLGVKSLSVYGGTGYGDQLAGLRSGANVIVGTPGRVVDHINKGYLKLNNLKTLILDEADEMISMGFKEDLETVLAAADKDQTNIWLFSATMGPDVRGVADNYLTDPKKVQVNRTEMLPDTVEQLYYKTHEYDKPEVLCKLIDAADDFYGIVFCQTKSLVADLNQYMVGRGYKVDCLHGDLDQKARDRVMQAFRDRKIQILIATDVACRGLDVKDITHVVNYSIPRELDNYVHRIGRTGRSGKTGIAMSLVTFSHRDLIFKIERMTKSKMKEGQIPTMKDIALKRLAKVRAAFETNGPQGRALAMIPQDWKEALATLTQEDVASRFLNLLVPDLFANPEKMADSRPAQKSDGEKRVARAEKFGEERARGGRSDRGGRGGREGGYQGRRDKSGGFGFKGRSDRGGPRGGHRDRGSYRGDDRSQHGGFAGKYSKDRGVRKDFEVDLDPPAPGGFGTQAGSRWKKPGLDAPKFVKPNTESPGSGFAGGGFAGEAASSFANFKPKKKKYGHSKGKPNIHS